MYSPLMAAAMFYRSPERTNDNRTYSQINLNKILHVSSSSLYVFAGKNIKRLIPIIQILAKDQNICKYTSWRLLTLLQSTFSTVRGAKT